MQLSGSVLIWFTEPRSAWAPSWRRLASRPATAAVISVTRGPRSSRKSAASWPASSRSPPTSVIRAVSSREERGTVKPSTRRLIELLHYFVRTSWAEAVREIQIRMRHEIRVDLFPVVCLVPNFLALAANGQVSLKAFHAIRILILYDWCECLGALASERATAAGDGEPLFGSRLHQANSCPSGGAARG